MATFGARANPTFLLRLFAIWSIWMGLSSQKDPLNDFCRRFGHQTTIIDRKLYIDGGLVNWNPISENPGNYTNTFLLYNDLDIISPNGEPQLYANLSKNGSIPNVAGGVLWADNINRRFYLFGGEYQDPSTTDTLELLSYDTIYDQWDSYGQPPGTINRVAYGAGASISARGEGYYYGGWLSNETVPGWHGDRVATSGLIKYTMDTNTWTNSSGPDNIPRAEGVMVYIPAGDRGMLVYFGGISTPYGNNTMVGMSMADILVYDIGGSLWYNQTATGDVPDMRRRFCAGATWAADQSSYNIYLYGGAGVPPNGGAFDDVYILSIPSFQWIKWYPTNGGPGKPHGWLSCNVIDGAQMMIIGGTFPFNNDCDAANVWGTHSLDLGKQNPDGAIWYQYRSNLTSYVVPSEIIAKVGGGPQGGATSTSPSTGWTNRDLPVLFSRKATVATRNPTRSFPSTSATASPAPILPTGAIAGIAVGSAAVLIALALGCYFCVRRNRRLKASTVPPQPPLTQNQSYTGYPSPYPSQAGYAPTASYGYYSAPSPQPAELASDPRTFSPIPHQYPHSPVHELVVQPKYDDMRSPYDDRSPYSDRQPQDSPNASPHSADRSPRAGEGWVGSTARSPAPEYESPTLGRRGVYGEARSRSG